jgi:hypothetical protein
MSYQSNSIKAEQPPFAPAWALLPKGQEPLIVLGETPAIDVLERMTHHFGSQATVGSRKKLIAVLNSLANRFCDLRVVRSFREYS